MDILGHQRPPIPALYVFCCPLVSKVTKCGVGLVQDLCDDVPIAWYANHLVTSDVLAPYEVILYSKFTVVAWFIENGSIESIIRVFFLYSGKEVVVLPMNRCCVGCLLEKSIP
jgi:hypothetical protein